MNLRSRILLLILVLGQAEVNFVAGGLDSIATSQTMAWSQDGINWIGITASPFRDQCSGIAYSSNQRKWLALGSGINTMAYSLDGKNWVGIGLSVFPVRGNRIHYSSSQNKWVATGIGANNIAYSTDGVSWSIAGTVFTTEANDVVHAPIGRWVAVGAGTHNIATSLDAVSWTGLGVSIFGGAGKGLSVDFEPSNSQFIAGGISSFFPYGVSTDGITWSGRVGIFSNQVSDAAYGQNKWVITGPATPLPTPFASATDAVGGTWTPCLPQTSIANGKALVYHPQFNRWVGTGSGSNQLVYSTDGNNWNGAGSPFQTSGLHLATTGTFLVLPPNLIFGTLVGILTVNSSTVLGNATANIQGSLQVEGDFYVLGGLNLSSNSVLNVTSTLTANGSLMFQVSPGSGNEIGTVTSQILIIDGATLTLVLNASLTQPTTYRVAEYKDAVGRFTRTAIQNTQSPSECYSQTPNYGPTTLSVTVSVANCPSGAVGQSSSPFPIWAIAIIVIVCVVIGSVIAALVIVLTRRQRIARTEAAKAMIHQKDLDLRAR